MARRPRNSNYIRRFECNICKKPFSAQNTLNIHKRSHLELKRIKCAHLGCEVGFNTNAALKTYKKRMRNSVSKTVKIQILRIRFLKQFESNFFAYNEKARGL